MKVNAIQLEKIFNVGRRQISEYQKKGMPHSSDPSGNTYELELVVPWRIEYEKSKAKARPESPKESELRLRKLEAETKLAETRENVESGKYWEVEKLEKEFTGLLLEFRASMLQMPNRITLQILGLRTEQEVKQVLNNEINSAWNSTANK